MSFMYYTHGRRPMYKSEYVGCRVPCHIYPYPYTHPDTILIDVSNYAPKEVQFMITCDRSYWITDIFIDLI